MNTLFKDCKLQSNGISFVLPSEVNSLLQNGAILVDLREEIETDIKTFGIGPVVYLPHGKFEEFWQTLPLDKPLILADSVGLWSKQAALNLHGKGFPDVASLAGGFNEWDRDGFPVKEGKCQQLDGPCLCMIKPHEKK